MTIQSKYIVKPAWMTVAHIDAIAERIADTINEHVNITCIEHLGQDVYKAFIFFDGLNDRGYRGSITFTCRFYTNSNGTIGSSDYVVHDLRGAGYQEGLYIEFIDAPVL